MAGSWSRSRPRPATGARRRARGGRHRPEVLLAHPMGIVEVYLGTADGPRITLQTDAVVRTTTAKEYSAAPASTGSSRAICSG